MRKRESVPLSLRLLGAAGAESTVSIAGSFAVRLCLKAVPRTAREFSAGFARDLRRDEAAAVSTVSVEGSFAARLRWEAVPRTARELSAGFARAMRRDEWRSRMPFSRTTIKRKGVEGGGPGASARAGPRWGLGNSDRELPLALHARRVR
jgi:hypothetical protein